MQAFRLVAPLVLLAFAAQGSATSSLEFSSAAPALLDGHAMTGSAMHWAVLVFPPGHGFRLDAALPHDGLLENFTAIRHSVKTDQGDQSGSYSVGRTGTESMGPLAGQLESAPGAWSSVYLEASNITFELGEFSATVAVTDPYHTLAGALEAWAPSGAFRPEMHEDVHEAVLLLDADQVRAVSVQAQDVRVLEWHNATWTCSSTACPRAPANQGATDAAQPFGVYPLEYRRLSTTGGQLETTGQVLGLAAAGDGFDLAASGNLRLPRIEYAPDCPAPCGNATFQVDGAWTLGGLHPTEDNRLAGRLSGDFAAARLDEVDVLDLLTGTTAKAVAGLGLVALVGVAASKFGRVAFEAVAGLNLAEPLGNRQRVLVLAAVAQNPGIDQSELSTKAQVARGTVRHHLRILLRADLLAERRIGKRNTYTLNDSSFEFPAGANAASTAGTAVALLRHPHRQALFRAVQQNGESDLQALLERLEEQGLGLARGTATYHLGLLERGGLLAKKRAGAHVLWTTQVDLNEIVSTQRHRFLTLGRLQGFLEALSPTPMPASALRERLHSHGWKGSLKDVTAKLDLLAATGYAMRTETGYARMAN